MYLLKLLSKIIDFFDFIISSLISKLKLSFKILNIFFSSSIRVSFLLKILFKALLK